MDLNQKQAEIKMLIEKVADAIGMDKTFPVAVALTESSLGLNQKSPTGARGVFQLTSIMMKDLLLEMEKKDDEVIDVLCGLAALHLLLDRWKSFDNAVAHYCDPADRDFYIKRVEDYMSELKGQNGEENGPLS